jgi:hypothetical protein
MILLVHMIFGAAIGSAVKSVPIAIILAILSHYFLDTLPHIEYDVGNIKAGNWQRAVPDILKVTLDFCAGILLIFVFSKNQPIIYICAFLAILPDGFTILNYLFPNKISDAHDKFHEKLHFLKHKKISTFWRISAQAFIVIVSIILLRI